MGSGNSSRAKAIQTINNNTVQESSTTCTATCQNTQNGDTTIFSGTTVTGDISAFSQVCKVSSSCVMTDQLSSQISDTLKSIAKQSQQMDSSITSLFADTHNHEKATLEQSINNSVTQILNSSCVATSSNVQNNDMFIMTNSKALSGVIAFSQTGDPTASCVMNNLSKIKLFNKETATISQTQRIENVFVAIVAMVVAALVIGAILLFLYFGSALMFGDDKSETTPAAVAGGAVAGGAVAGGAVAGGMVAGGEEQKEEPEEKPEEEEQKEEPEEEEQEGDKKDDKKDDSGPGPIFYKGGSSAEKETKEGEEEKVEDNPSEGEKEGEDAGEDAGEGAEAAGEGAEAAGVAGEAAEAAEFLPLVLL